MTNTIPQDDKASRKTFEVYYEKMYPNTDFTRYKPDSYAYKNDAIDEEWYLWDEAYQAALAHERQRNTSGEEVAKIIRNEAGQVSLQDVNGNGFNMSKYIGQSLFTAPPQSPSVREALEAAAKICANQPAKDKILQEAGGQDPEGDYVIGYRDGCVDCANRIRALIQDTKAEES